MVSVMLICVRNMELTYELHKAIKLNFINGSNNLSFTPSYQAENWARSSRDIKSAHRSWARDKVPHNPNC